MGEGTPGGGAAHPPRPPSVRVLGGHLPSLRSGRVSSILLTHVHNFLDACQDERVIPPARTRRSPVDRFDLRRNELAESALLTLGELGYARTSLRDIASNSPFSHGVLHYYFADKLELVIYSVTYYKMRCLTRYDQVLEDSTTEQELLDGFAAKLVETIVEEAPMHRLWYDLRSQSMFEPGLNDAVSHIDSTLADMIWRVMTRYAELAGASLAVDKPEAYGMLDGIFQQALLGHQREPGGAHLNQLERQVQLLLPLMISRGSRSQ
jgi:TetR/AcrR family transcriptional repressor of bet genes